jgi:transcription-repair coupling factor (superfamily II helicase)
LIDRYGDPPLPVQNLVGLSRLRIRAAAVHILNISQRNGDIRMEFTGTAEQLIERARRPLQAAFGGQVRVKTTPKPVITIKRRIQLGAVTDDELTAEESAEKIKRIEQILVTLSQLGRESGTLEQVGSDGD